MALDRQKALFFFSSFIPTEAEVAAMEKVKQAGFATFARSKILDPKYGDVPEETDVVAGDPPSDYDATPNVNAIAGIAPRSFHIIPDIKTFAHTLTLQLYALKEDLDANKLPVITDLTGDAAVSWGSNATGVATVNASSGLVTGVAAGSVRITATYEYETGHTIQAICDLTLT